MVSSTTRASRSRFSSPAQHLNGSQKEQNDHSKTSASTQASRDFMQRWLEPTVQAKASFEDDGLMRYGVVENMAPLGALPKNKKPAPETTSTVRKIILRPSGASLAKSASEPEPAAEAPASASPPPAPALPSTPPRRKSIAVKIPVDDDEEDEDYEPKLPAKRRQSGRASLARRTRRSSGARRSSAAEATKPESPKETKASPKEAKEATEANETKQPSRSAPEDKEFTEKVIESAVDEALKHYRYPTAWALRTLYDENSHDRQFVAMIEDIFHQTADADTLRKWSKQIEDKKREGKKDNQGCYYFIPPSTNHRFTPHKPKTAPYAYLLHRHQGQEDQEEEDGDDDDDDDDEAQSERGRAPKRAKTSHSGHTHTHTHSHATRDSPRKMASGGSNSASASDNNHNGVNREQPSTPPFRRRAPRRDSASSDSSLSSAMSLSSPEVSIASVSPTRRGGGRTNRPGPEPSAGPKSQPITTRRKSLAAQSKQPPSSPSTSTSPIQINSSNDSEVHASASASMPGRVSAAQLFPNLPSKSSKTAKGKVPMPQEEASSPNEDAESFWNRRRDARRFTNSATVTESSVRGASEEQLVTPVKKQRKTRQSIVVPPTTRSTRSASKRPHDELDIAVSPVAWSFQGEGSSTVGSRAVTPTLRPAKKQRSGLRVKSSPVKKRGGTAAGLPRSSGDSAVPGASKDQVSDNEEECSACGAAGDVVCCDGCPRSFHFECVGMSRSDPLPDEWYCNECMFSKFPSKVPVHKGVFASALNHLEKSIPRSYSLPKELQERFEGVKAGPDGGYEEITATKTTRKKPGYEEVVDFFKQREDGQAVLCHGCQKSATDVRAIMPCSVCSLHWHLDCLDPPLAVPHMPKTWRCPAHADDVRAQAQRAGPAHRYRKAKDGPVITPAISRGLKNNGIIEVDWSDEPDLPNNSGWPDPASFGKTYKLQANGLILDCIEQLRRQGAGYGPRQDEQRWLSYLPLPVEDPNRPIKGSDMQRTVNEIQVALSLNGLKLSRSENIDQLISALLQNADPSVVALMAKNNANSIATGKLTEGDKIGLRALLAQMDAMSARIRDVLGEAPRMLERDNEMSNILSPEESVIDATGKMTPTPVTEPTPPSTFDHAEGSMDLD
ncbi:hypothetical protein B0T10DRAFT_556868 [Thelonectria olida]|uniref:PHD-type domain-containing protein n=1 Tax=Thelonectria olida TaxID=1576542 RepID=A0A9P9AU69_9HYPO|nr:hypothetical protein B0T10DRAFT_556868 [Thelonectria olida]